MRSTILAVLVLASGCASLQTPYAPEGFRGGYSERELATGVWLISVRTNAVTSEERAIDYLHRRAAEIALRESCGDQMLENVTLDVNSDGKTLAMGTLRCTRSASR